MKRHISVLLLLGGCAGLSNTPEQEYVYAMARPCEGKGTRITWVVPDGKQYRGMWEGGPSAWPEFQACMAEQTKAHPLCQLAQDQGLRS